MAFYFAWVADGTVAFNAATHDVEDLAILSFSLTQTEGDAAQLTIDVLNPGSGLLSGPIWAWFSWDSGSGVEPLGLFRLVGAPENMQGEVVTLVLVAKPDDYEDQRTALAATLRVLPEYDPVFVPPDQRENPDFVLEGRPALWHVDPITHELTISSIVEGEDGLLEFGATTFYDSVGVSFGEPPVTRADVTAQIKWLQKATGAVDITAPIVSEFAEHGVQQLPFICSYTGGGLVTSWPVVGTDFGGGWTVAASQATRVDDAFIPLTCLHVPVATGGFGNNEEANIRVAVANPLGELASTPYGARTYYDALSYGETGEDVGEPTTILVPRWNILASLTVGYEAEIERVENLAFSLNADVQPIVTDTSDDLLTINMSSAEVDKFIDTPAAAASYVTNIVLDIPDALTQPPSTTPAEFGVISAGTTGTFTAAVAPTATTQFQISVVNDVIGYGEMVAGQTTGTVTITASHQYGPTAPLYVVPLSTDATFADGILTLSPIAAPLTDGRRESYLKTDRGKQSLEHLILRARARLLSRARCVTLSFEDTFEAVVPVTLRHSAELTDPRLPGGVAAGKVISRTLSMSNGEMKGSVTVGCSIGMGGELLVSDFGDATYVDGVFDDGVMQVWTGGITALPEQDVTYENFDGFPVASPGFDLADMRATDVIKSVAVANGMTEQEALMVGTRTPGTGTGYLVNHSGGYPAGTTTIAVDTGTGTILKGDVIVFFGGHRHTVTEALSGGNITISPPLRLAVPDNWSFTIDTSPREWLDSNEVIAALNENHTRVAVSLKPVAGQPPLETPFNIVVSDLIVPKTIDLEAA